MLNVYNSLSVPPDVKRQVASWQDSDRAMTGYCCFEFASLWDDILVFTEHNEVIAVGLLCLDHEDSVSLGQDMTYLAFFATKRAGVGRDTLRYIADYAYHCGFAMCLVSKQSSLGFYRKCDFIRQVTSDGFMTV